MLKAGCYETCHLFLKGLLDLRWGWDGCVAPCCGVLPSPEKTQKLEGGGM